jgi:hypothetical protein
MRRVSAVFASVLAFGVVGMASPVGAQTPEPTSAVCSLLTVGEVGTVLGQPVSDGVATQSELPGNGGTEDRCTWETTASDTGIISGSRLQFVASVQSNCARPNPKGCFRSDKQEAESDHEEKDLKKIRGNEAFYVFTGEVEVLVGQRILNVHFNYFDTNMFSRRRFERRTVDAAKKAVKRL